MSNAEVLGVRALRGAVRSDPGLRRANNEDVPVFEPDRSIYGVIDGVGGHAAGEIAAETARDVILGRLARPLGTPAERVREAIAIANNEIFRRAEASAELQGMTCVITLALVSDGLLTVGHVGDSRLYKVRADGMRKLTHDHSPVGEREEARELSEFEAMRHPRRNEVFRDVGSAYRDKDEEDFVEIVEEPFERDSAILLCTDGLTDMVPSAAIERIVRQHAGHPQQIVDALVGAANGAGGKDNVTVVYAEGAGFAAAVAASMSHARGGNGTPAPDPGPPESVPAAAVGRRRPRASAHPAVRLAAAVVRSRITWFALGALAGVASALYLAWQAGAGDVGAPRTLVVNPASAASFPRISDGLAAARAGDLVQIEPGTYLEHVTVPGGVELAARIPGTVIVRRPPGLSGEAVGIAVAGVLPTHVHGIRLESTPDAPLDVGVRVAGPRVTLSSMDVAGPMRAGIEVGPAASLTLDGSFLEVRGAAITVADHAEAILARNVFLRAGSASPPVLLAASADAALHRNVFAGFGPEIVKGLPPAELKRLAQQNIVTALQPVPLR